MIIFQNIFFVIWRTLSVFKQDTETTTCFGYYLFTNNLNKLLKLAIMFLSDNLFEKNAKSSCNKKTNYSKINVTFQNFFKVNIKNFSFFSHNSK